MKVFSKKTFLSLLIVLTLVGCGDEEILHYKVPKEKKAPVETTAPPSSTTNATESDNNKDLTWEAPEGWIHEPGSGMRFATFKFNADGKPAECTLVKLGGMAGGLVPNINRWRGQIGLSDSDEKGILDSLQTMDGKSGSFQITEIINPNDPEKAILASIINGKDFTLFVKIMATKAQVELAKADFTKFSASIRIAE